MSENTRFLLELAGVVIAVLIIAPWVIKLMGIWVDYLQWVTGL